MHNIDFLYTPSHFDKSTLSVHAYVTLIEPCYFLILQLFCPVNQYIYSCPWEVSCQNTSGMIDNCPMVKKNELKT